MPVQLWIMTQGCMPVLYYITQRVKPFLEQDVHKISSH